MWTIWHKSTSHPITLGKWRVCPGTLRRAVELHLIWSDFGNTLNISSTRQHLSSNHNRWFPIKRERDIEREHYLENGERQRFAWIREKSKANQSKQVWMRNEEWGLGRDRWNRVRWREREREREPNEMAAS